MGSEEVTGRQIKSGQCMVVVQAPLAGEGFLVSEVEARGEGPVVGGPPPDFPLTTHPAKPTAKNTLSLAAQSSLKVATSAPSIRQLAQRQEENDERERRIQPPC